MRFPQFVLTHFSQLALRSPAFAQPVLRFIPLCLGLPLTAKLVDFAMEFETAYKTDDWSIVQNHFAPEATYEVRNTSFDCLLNGPEKIVAGFKSSLDGFDRNLKRSMSVVEGPFEQTDSITFVWVGNYSLPGNPPLVISARQTLHFRDGLIYQLTDDYMPGHGERAAKWIETHGPHLTPKYDSE